MTIVDWPREKKKKEMTVNESVGRERKRKKRNGIKNIEKKEKKKAKKEKKEV